MSSLGDFSALLSSTPATESASPDGNLVRTVRVGSMAMSVPPGVVLPKLADGYANTTIEGVEYRVRTFTVGGATIALGAPVAETQRRISELHWRVVLICGGVIIGTVVVGWFFSLIMIDPVPAAGPAGSRHQCPIQTRGGPGPRGAGGSGDRRGGRGMLARIGNEQARTKAALESARDFAAVASHELRTPLTAMRTNLEVLSTLDLGAEQRQEVIGDTMRTQTRIEATLTALERLAQGN